MKTVIDALGALILSVGAGWQETEATCTSTHCSPETLTDPSVAFLCPPDTIRVTLPVGGGAPDPLTVSVRLPRQLGNVKPAWHASRNLNTLA